MAVMAAHDLATKCLEIAQKYLTCYVWGAIGQPVNERTIADRVAQYPLNRTSGYEARAKALIGKTGPNGKGPFMFDCVNMAKSLMWGWRGDSTAWYGGAKYLSNGVPDVSADGMISLCKDVSNGFGDIAVGEALWLPGHFGVYVGNGLAVECTPAWKGGVQITAVGNMGPVSGYPTRQWAKHGKLPYIDYSGAKHETKKNSKIIIDGQEIPIDRVLQGGYNYFKLRDLAEAMGEKWPYEISNKGSTAVLTSKK